MEKAEILNRTSQLIEFGEGVLQTHTPNSPNVIGFPTLDTSEYARWRTRVLAFLESLLGKEHVYTREFESKTDQAGYTSSVNAGIGILRSVHDDANEGTHSLAQETVGVRTRWRLLNAD